MLWYVLKHNLEYCEHKLHIPIVQFQSRMINSQRIPTNGTFHSYFLSFKMNIKYNICVRIITYSQSFQTWYLLYLLQVHKKICLMLSNDNKTNDQLPILPYTHLYFTCRSYHNNILITERRITEVNNKMFLYCGLLKWICTYFSLASNILNKWIKRFSVCMCQGMHSQELVLSFHHWLQDWTQIFNTVHEELLPFQTSFIHFDACVHWAPC